MQNVYLKHDIRMFFDMMMLLRFSYMCKCWSS